MKETLPLEDFRALSSAIEFSHTAQQQSQRIPPIQVYTLMHDASCLPKQKNKKTRGLIYIIH